MDMTTKIHNDQEEYPNLNLDNDECSKINGWDVDKALERLNGFRLITKKEDSEEYSE